MEQPPKEGEGKDPKFDPGLVSGKWWTDFNQKGPASYGAASDMAELPAPVVSAVTGFAFNGNNLGAEAVGWNLTCLTSDGTRRLRGPTHLPGGSRSGSGCGEDSLWAVPKNPNQKAVKVAKGSKEFGYLGVVYLIDAGLCPCLRCCGSLLSLAKETKSTIVVRPQFDYELIAKHRTELSSQAQFFLVFLPTATEFLVFHSSPNEAPSDPQERDVSAHPTQAWCRCSQAACAREFTVVYPAEKAKVAAVKDDKVLGKAVKVQCPHCNHDGMARVVAKAKGAFPAIQVQKGYF